MIKKVLIVFILLFLSPIFSIPALGFENVEIFDFSKEEVVKIMPSTPKIQKEVKRYLSDITGIYAKFNPIPEKGFAVKVLLQPPVAVKNQHISSTVDEVIIVFPKEDKPFLMVFEADDNLICYDFNSKTNKLLKRLNFPLDYNVHPETLKTE